MFTFYVGVLNRKTAEKSKVAFLINCKLNEKHTNWVALVQFTILTKD